MGKADFLSPKAIANRIKSKGLQKLRWYCQMCQKQCRDEVGSWGKETCCLLSRRDVSNTFSRVVCCSTERLQVSLHVRVPPAAAAAGLGEPQPVHGLLLKVGAASSSSFSSFLRDVGVPQSLIRLPLSVPTPPLSLSLSASSRVISWSCSGDVLVSLHTHTLVALEPLADVLGVPRCF